MMIFRSRSARAKRTIVQVTTFQVALSSLLLFPTVTQAQPLRPTPARSTQQARVSDATEAVSEVQISGETKVLSAASQITGAPTPDRAVLLQTARVGKDFHIIFSGLPNEVLELELGFAELQNAQPGQRIFTVDVNDKRALPDFDIVAAAGGPGRAVVRRFTITPQRGTIDFHFFASIGEAAINYVRVKGRGIDKLVAANRDPNATPILPDVDAAPPGSPDYNDLTGEVQQDAMSPTWPYGFPVGGIGAGKIEVLPNGEFANITINNNWDLPISRVPGTFFAIATKASSGVGQARVLRVPSSDVAGGNYASARPVLGSTFKAQFPFAEWNFQDDKLPINVRLEAFTPLVPQSVDDSTLPAGIFYVHLQNPKSFPVSVGVALSWEDINGRGGSRISGDQYPVAGQAIHGDAATSTVQGVMIRSSAPADGRRGSFVGDYFIGSPVKRAVVTRQLYWDPKAADVPWWKTFVSKMRLERIPAAPATVAPAPARGSSRNNGATAVCVTVNLRPKEKRRIPFIVAWHVPKITTLGQTGTAVATDALDYSTTFASALGVAGYVASKRILMHGATQEWQGMVLRSNLPQWLKLHSLNSVSTLASNAVLLEGRRFSMLESPGEMGGMMGALDHRLAAQPFLTAMWPSLDRTELELFSRAQAADGHLPRYLGNIHGGWTGMNPKMLGDNWTDPTASWVVQAARHYTATGDSDFWEKMQPSLERALDYIEKGDTDGDNQVDAPTALDEASPSNAVVAYNTGKAAAAFRAVTQLGPDRYASREPKARALKNAYIEMVKTYAGEQGTSGTFAAALAGDWALRSGGIAPLLEDETLSRALTQLQRRHMERFAPIVPMEIGADGSAPRGVPSFPLLLQPYLGAEAALAGFPSLGMNLYQRVQNLATRTWKAPWRLPLTATVPEGERPRLRSHLASASGFSALQAFSGAYLDVPGKVLYLNPQVPEELDGELTLPVFTPAFWGWLDYDARECTGTLAVTKVFAPHEEMEIRSVAQRPGADGKPVNLKQLDQPLVLRDGEVLTLTGWPCRPEGELSVSNPGMAALDEATTTTAYMDEGTTISGEFVLDNATSPSLRSQNTSETLTGDAETTDSSDATTTGPLEYGP